jgi:hypothetical protein
MQLVYRYNERDALIIPAGCAAQASGAAASTSVTLPFLSAESTAAAMRLTGAARMLPAGHPERRDVNNVRAMVIRWGGCVQVVNPVETHSLKAPGLGAVQVESSCDP